MRRLNLGPRGGAVLSRSAVYLASNILNAAIPFALLPILTRYLTPAEYGEIAIFLALLSGLAAFVGVSATGAAARKHFDPTCSSERMAKYLGACVTVVLVSATVVGLIMIAARRTLHEWLGLTSTWIYLAVLVSACTVLVQLRLSQWQVRGNARSYGVMQVAQSATNMALSLTLVIVAAMGAAGRIGAQVVTSAGFAVVAVWLLRRDRLLLFIPNAADVKDILSFGVPLIPHVGGAFLLASVDRLVINDQLGLYSAGIYMVAVQLASAMAIIFDAINKAYVPWLFEKLNRNNHQEKKQIVKYTYWWCLAVLIGSAVTFFVGPWLVPLLAGAEYAPAGKIFGWLAMGQAFGGMYLMVTNYAFYAKRTGLLSIATISSGLINVALLVVLVRTLGLEGAAISFSISMAARVALTWAVAQHSFPMPWFSFRKTVAPVLPLNESSK